MLGKIEGRRRNDNREPRKILPSLKTVEGRKS